MARDSTLDDLRRAGRLSAMRRLDELRREEAAIRVAFPELFAGPGGRVATRVPAKTRATMPTAMRKAVSERMKKYWAARRTSKNG